MQYHLQELILILDILIECWIGNSTIWPNFMTQQKLSAGGHIVV
jgi:hypothetical protein